MRALFLFSGGALVEFEREPASLAAEICEFPVELPRSQRVRHLQPEALLPGRVETVWKTGAIIGDAQGNRLGHLVWRMAARVRRRFIAAPRRQRAPAPVRIPPAPRLGRWRRIDR